MGILKLAFVSLKKDASKSILYFFIMALNAFFIFSFFNFVFNPVTEINLGKDDPTFVTFIAAFVILVAMLCVFLANTFYRSTKTKEISILLMSGASVYKMGMYLLIQTGVLMFLGIILGVAIGYITLPMIQILFSGVFIDTTLTYGISSQGIIATIIILTFEIFWSTLINIGYCYRSSVQNLSTIKIDWGEQGFHKRVISPIVWVILYILPLVIFMVNTDVMGNVLFSLIGIFGIYGMIRYLLPQYISKKLKEKDSLKSIDYIALGYLRYDMQNILALVIMILFFSILLMSLIVYHLEVPLIAMISIVSFGSVMVLMVITIFSKMLLDIPIRKKDYQKMAYLGYIDKQLKQIIHKEMIWFYGIIGFLPLLYEITMLVKLYLQQQVTISLISLILLLQITPIGICCLGCILLYQKVLPKQR